MMNYDHHAMSAHNITINLIEQIERNPRYPIMVSDLDVLYSECKHLLGEFGYAVSGDVITKELNK